MKQFFGKKKLAKLVTLSVMTGAMLGIASGAWAAPISEETMSEKIWANGVNITGTIGTYDDPSCQVAFYAYNGGKIDLEIGNVIIDNVTQYGIYAASNGTIKLQSSNINVKDAQMGVVSTSKVDIISDNKIEFTNLPYAFISQSGGIINVTAKDIVLNNCEDLAYNTGSGSEINIVADNITVTQDYSKRDVLSTYNHSLITVNSGKDTGIFTINKTVTNESEYFYGFACMGSAGEVPGGKVKIGGEALNINITDKSGGTVDVRAIHASNNYISNADDDNRTFITLASKNTNIVMEDESGNPMDAVAFSVMSEGKVVVDSNLYVKADAILYVRGNSDVYINTDGKHTTKLNGDVNFGFEGTSSGSAIDSDVQINLTGKESYWNGNSLISWSDPNGKPDDSLLAVTGFALTIADGAIWTPTYVDGLDEDNPAATKGCFYNKVNTLTMNDGTNGGGVINVVEDNTKIPQVQAGVLNGTKGVVNMVDGAVFEVGVNDNKDLTVNGGKLVYSTDAEAKVDAGEKLTLNGVTLTQKLTNNGTMNLKDTTIAYEVDSPNTNKTALLVDGNDAVLNIQGDYVNVSIKGTNVPEGKWMNGLYVGEKGTSCSAQVNFTGKKLFVTADSQGHTSQGFVTQAGTTAIINPDVSGDTGADVNDKNFEVKASGNYGANAVVNHGTMNFVSGDVYIEAEVPGVKGYSNVQGIISDGYEGEAILNVGEGVGIFEIKTKGRGQFVQPEACSDGTAGITLSSDTDPSKKGYGVMNINPKKFIITGITDGDPGSSDGKYSIFGMIVSDKGVLKVGANTDTSITVSDEYLPSIGIMATDLYGAGGGSVSILGNTTISATGHEDAKAICVTGGGSVTLGSEGKTVDITGDVYATGEGSNVTITAKAPTEEGGVKTFYSNITGSVKAEDKSVINLTNTFVNGSVDNSATMNFANVSVKGVAESSDVIKNTGIINLIAGTFDDNFVTDASDNGTSTGTLNLVQKGIYETTAAKVYTNTDAKEKDAGAVTAAAKAKINFVGGTLALTDTEYTMDYAKSAQTNMSNVEVNSKKSNTQVVMLGNLINFTENEIDVQYAGKVGSDVALDKVEAKTQEKNLLVGSGKSDQTLFEDQYVTAVEKGFSVQNLDLEEHSTGMIITNDEKVTLGGTEGGNLVKVGGEEKNVKVVVGVDENTDVEDADGQPITAKTGILNIGNPAVEPETEFVLKGSLLVNKDSEVNVKGQTEITEKVELKGATANVAEGAKLSTPLFQLDDSFAHVSQAAVVEAKKITVESTEKADQSKNSVITGKVTAESLNMSKATGDVQDKTVVLNVGTEEKSAVVDVKDTALAGNMLFLDPAWKDGENLVGDASHYATETTDLDGAYVVGRNSILTFGATNADADALFGSTDLNWGENDVSAAAYVASNINVADGSLMVDGSKTQAPDMPAVGSVNFAANSLFMVNGDNCQGSAAVTGVKSAEVDGSSKLFIAHAIPNTTYKILAGEGITSGWLVDNVVVKGTIDGLDVDLDPDHLYFNVTTGETGFNVPGTVMPNVADAILNGGQSKALDALETMTEAPTVEQQAANVNAYANMGENLGVSRGAYDVANMVGNAVTEHWDNNAKGENIWAVYTHSKNKVDGMELGGMDAQFDAQYNGVVVGADLSKGFGIALNYTDGNVSNGFGGHNDAKYYGGSIYGRKVFGNWNLFGDVTYTHGKNELAQGGIEADAKTNTISAGLTAKYLNKAGKYATIAPFAGVRYMHIDGKDYTDTLGVNREADKINSVVVPVGLEYTGEFKMNKSGWNWKPRLAVGYLFNLGDRENDMTMRYGGAEDIFGYDFVDKGAFFTHAGMDFENKNFTLGLSYDFMKSKNSKNNKWNVNANVAF